MLHNNKILLQLKNKLSKISNYLEGIVKIINKNFVILSIKNKKMYNISITYLDKIMCGDRVLFFVKSNSTLEEAIPIKLLQSNINIFIGNIKKINNKLYFIPLNNANYKHNLIISHNRNIYNLKDDDLILAKIINHPLQNFHKFKVEIIEYFPYKNKYLLQFWKIFSKYNIDISPPSDSLCHNIKIIDNNTHRRDLTKLCFITIDNINTKDIDDAIYIEEINTQQLQIYVAIADPTSYIEYNSKIDIIASNRMFTTYFPEFIIPLLPKYISENICSLQPMQIRSTLVCKMIINNDGILLQNAEFFMGLIQSKAQLNYVNVSNWLDNIGTWQPENYEIKNQINLLYKSYIYRRQWSKKNTIFFNNPIYKLIMNDQLQILNIKLEPKRIAHKIIEEIMVAANICAAEILYKFLGFGIYNVYYGFNYKKINKIVFLLNEYNIQYKTSILTTLQGYKHIYQQLKKQKLLLLLNRIRKYQLATIFQSKPGPHFGLGVLRYATWTSPLRKFGDLINHRLIKAIIQKKCINKPSVQIIHNMNYKKRLNKQIENRIINWLYIEYCKNILNDKQIFVSEIIDVLLIGLKVRLIKNGMYALIPINLISSISNNIIILPMQGKILYNNKILYKVTDYIKVMIEKIDVNNNIIVKIIS
ncbi:exoribonuclease II [Enterobacteriaceae endosymbiont of Neohaemonia nigricornis]|uniref:exoribonuclease II n=1 Tax=Enterobacteriaceae endosymbiont of Neohaemonia nigricornis TaxID=2675792 RepID=UPI0014498A15|nr:exoribonuclease II [Enterobacteriaceae endosymbiont of Neohaemonia nigricornis]QJC30231.1 exoribonuclease II [Enterobacteriaceae endosymbiont of Neohaemonia nigricornis]